VTVYYVDSSVAHRALLGDPPHVAEWFDSIVEAGHSLVGSRILRLELTRVLRREGLPVAMRDDILDKVDLLALEESVLAAAEAIGPHIKSLDAIHVATAVVSGLNPVVVTHDARMKAVLADFGLDALDPV